MMTYGPLELYLFRPWLVTCQHQATTNADLLSTRLSGNLNKILLKIQTCPFRNCILTCTCHLQNVGLFIMISVCLQFVVKNIYTHCSIARQFAWNKKLKHFHYFYSNMKLLHDKNIYIRLLFGVQFKFSFFCSPHLQNCHLTSLITFLPTLSRVSCQKGPICHS